MLRDLGRVLVGLPAVEWGRLFLGPDRLLAKLRRSGCSARARAPIERQALRRVIATVDARLPGGANCYRRALVETLLDAGAANEKMYFGLKAQGGPRSGHAWLASWPDAGNAGAYDA